MLAPFLRRVRAVAPVFRQQASVVAPSAPTLRWATSSSSDSDDAAPAEPVQQRRVKGSPLPVQFQDVSKAAFQIRGAVEQTPVRYSPRLSDITECSLWFKKDYLLTTGSFKERGAVNALLRLTPEQRERGVIAASAGNHALALAYHGRRLGIPVSVAMPTVAPMTKIQNCRGYNARVMLRGNHLNEAREAAMELAEKEGLQYINGFDDPAIIAGAGTMGLEVVNQVDGLDAVVIPVGGGGLIAGCLLAIKTLRPDVKVYGVEPAGVPSMKRALEAGHPVTIQPGPTIADGLNVSCVGSNAFEIVHELVDDIVVVEEKYVALAMLRLMEVEKAVVEGGGATGLAALLAGLLPDLKGKRVLAPLCGGNVDTNMVAGVIERGLAVDGRLVTFSVVVSDRPGGIATFSAFLGEIGASIKELHHERSFPVHDFTTVVIKVVAETTGPEHSERMYEHLRKAGYNPVPQQVPDQYKTSKPKP